MNNERCDIEKDQCVDIIFRATACITLPQRRLNHKIQRNGGAGNERF